MADDDSQREDFERWFEGTWDELVGAAYLSVANLDEARDLAQETFARAWQHWAKVSRHANRDAWARQVVHNLAVSRWRRLRVERTHMERPRAHFGPPDADHVDLARLVARLPQDQRRAMNLDEHGIEHRLQEAAHAAAMAAPRPAPGDAMQRGARRRKRAQRARWASSGIVALLVVAVFLVPLPHFSIFSTRPASPPASTVTPVPSHHHHVTSPTRAWGDAVSAVHFLTTSTGWVVTQSPNRLLFTTNAGRTWRDVTPPAARLANAGLLGDGGAIAGAFLSPSRWFVAASGEKSGRQVSSVYETSDAGRTWRLAGAGLPGAANSLYFLDGADGWLESDILVAMGQNPVTIYGTRNGGATWTRLSASAFLNSPGTPGALTSSCIKQSLTFSTVSIGWVALVCNGARTPMIARTGDGGRTWTLESLPAAGSTAGGIYGFPPVFSSASTGAAGLDTSVAVVYSTSDGGTKWTAHVVPGTLTVRQSIIDVISPEEWLVGTGASIHVTTDAGRSWSAVPSGTQFTSVVGSVDFVDTTNGWATSIVTEGLLHTTDGGRTGSAVRLAAGGVG